VDYAATWRVTEGYENLIKLLDFFMNEGCFVTFLRASKLSSTLLMGAMWHPFNRLTPVDISAFRAWSNSLVKPLNAIAKAKGISVDECMPKVGVVY
jgi:hypothetical protein